MKHFWIGAWEHTAPEQKYNVDGKRSIIKQLCFGPLETLIYGVTKDSRYYFEYHIIEGIQAGDIFFEYINKSKILKAIYNEIELCKKYHADEMIPLFQVEVEKIKKDNPT